MRQYPMASLCYCNREGIKSWLRAATASAARPTPLALAPLLTCCFSVSRSISKFSLEAGSVRRVEGSACAAPASHSAVDAGPKDEGDPEGDPDRRQPDGHRVEGLARSRVAPLGPFRLTQTPAWLGRSPAPPDHDDPESVSNRSTAAENCA